MNSDWEQCEKGRGWEPEPERERLYVSINRLGDIAMSAAAYGELGEICNVALLYDAKRRRIGVKYPVYGDGRFFAMQRHGRGGRMRVVRAARLLKQFKIVIEETLYFPNPSVEIFEKVPMLILDLKTAVPVGRRQLAVAVGSGSRQSQGF